MMMLMLIMMMTVKSSSFVLTGGDAVLDAKSLDEVSVATNVPADLDGRRTQNFWTVHEDDLTGEFLRDDGHVKRWHCRPIDAAVSCTTYEIQIR